MRVDGHCHCGEITFEAEVDPVALTICHCTDCQTLTRSAFCVNIPASAEHFVLRGTPKSYVKTAESGNKRRHAFCGDCGTPIYALRGGQSAKLFPARRYDHSARGLLTAAADLAAFAIGVDVILHHDLKTEGPGPNLEFERLPLRRDHTSCRERGEGGLT